MKTLTIALFLFTSLAQAQPCAPMDVPDANTPLCGPIEMKALQLAAQKGMLGDIKHYIDNRLGMACAQKPTTAEIVYQSPGAHQTDEAVLFTTEVECRGEPGTISDINHFPVLVELESKKVSLIYKTFEN